MQTLLLGTQYLPSATFSLDLVLQYSITLNATDHEVVIQFGQILTCKCVPEVHICENNNYGLSQPD